MRIGLDATCWLLRRGFGRHTRCLINALIDAAPTHDYTLFVDSPEAAAAVPVGPTIRTVPTRVPAIDAAATHGRRRVGDLIRMSLALSTAPLDAVVFPTIYSYVPMFGRTKRVVMVHDVTAEAFPALTLDGRRARWLWTLKVALGRRQADRLVTVSDYSRRRIAGRFGLDPDRIALIGEAPDPIFRVLDHPPSPAFFHDLRLVPGRRLVVYVGGFSPHKNLSRLVAVFARLARRPAYADCDLVLVGDHTDERFHTHYAALAAEVAATGLGGRVIITGFVDDTRLVTLLNAATVLALPSLTEGYGLPAVEAAACGCPVVATTESPLPALLGAGGVYVDPQASDALEAALAGVLDSPARRVRMREAGLAAARVLSWTAPARALVTLLSELTGLPADLPTTDDPVTR